MSESARQGQTLPDSIGGRFTVDARLGRGGMAEVYRVRDGNGRALALKRLLPTRSARQRAQVTELFEQEFHTLAQLAHPRIVRVDDYVGDSELPYYTMELLEGEDLRQRSPLPWRELCSLLCDVCSALSLLHSRRLVHRDLTPANVHCTDGGQAKLIDLGALTQAGACKQVVGTPAFIAPEAVRAQHVDARTDLFALGATAYYALTGRHAYPARRIGDLRTAWQRPPVAPSRLQRDVPPALDDLVMSLLDLQAIARPGSAAEVMDRLSAIAELEIAEELRVQRAYLSTPALVGRHDPLLRVRKQLVRAMRRRGGSMLITGAPGVGRSRFLDACVLEAKLLGGVALRTDARDGSRDWGAAAALVTQLLELTPEVTRALVDGRAGVLATALPQLFDDATTSMEVPTFAGPQQARAAVATALGQVLTAASDRQLLVVAADDLDVLDAPSAALISWLASQTQERGLVVLASIADGDDHEDEARAAARFLAQTSSAVRLRNLAANDSEQLLVSVFGDVPNVRLLADRLHTRSRGNPGAIMQLAQHLLDAGALRYHAGVWALPAQLSDDDLPASAVDVLRARIAQLDEVARAIAHGLALTSLPSFSLEECAELAALDDGARASAALETLLARGVVLREGTQYTLATGDWKLALGECPDALAGELHTRLARVMAGRPGESYRQVLHLTAAGEHGAALDVLVPYLNSAYVRTENEPAQYYDAPNELPPGWLPCFRTLLRACDELGRSARERFSVLLAIASFGPTTAMSVSDEVVELCEQLEVLTGLDIYHGLDPELPAGDRLGAALTQAQERFDALPEEARVRPPIDAIQLLSRATLLAIGLCGRTFDSDLLPRIPSLEPYRALSPALPIVIDNRDNTMQVQAGRVARGARGCVELIERAGEEAPPGLAAALHAAMRHALMWGAGVLTSYRGIAIDRWADEIEQSPLFEVSAWRLRAIQAFAQGDAERGEELRRHVELLRMRNRPPQLFEGTYMWTEAIVHSFTDDLPRTRQLIPALEAMAREHPGWIPCAAYARAHYQRMRGDYAACLAEVSAVLPALEPGRHVTWAPITTTHTLALLLLGRGQQALERARDDHRRALQHELEGMYYTTERVLALALAEAGELEQAVEHADRQLEEQHAAGVTGVLLGVAHETRARVALKAGDQKAFEEHAAQCAEHYRAGHNATLSAKYERLMREARMADVGVSEVLERAAMRTFTAVSAAESTIATMLGRCAGPAERAERALHLISEGSEVRSAFLFVVREAGPELVATRGAAEAPADLESHVRQYLTAELEDADTATATVFDDPEAEDNRGWAGVAGECLVPVLLSHPEPEGPVVTGMAVLAVAELQSFEVDPLIVRSVSRSLRAAGDATTAVTAA